MEIVGFGLILVAIAYASCGSALLAYIMAWLIGAGALCYTIGSGLEEGALGMWALAVGLAVIGHLKDRVSPTKR